MARRLAFQRQARLGARVFTSVPRGHATLVGVSSGWIAVFLLLGALAGVVAGYVVGSEGPLEEGALGLAAATIGGLIALLGAFGKQMVDARRNDIGARHERQEAVMLRSYDELTEIYRVTLDYAKRKRVAVVPVEGALAMGIARAKVRPLLEMIDDNKLRELAAAALDSFATTAIGIAPDRPEEENTDDESRADLEANRKTLDAMGGRITEIARTWHGDTRPD